MTRNGTSAAAPGDPPGEPPEQVPQQLVEELVTAATLAPSMHNTQPWRFRFQPARQTIELYADPDRMLRFGDPGGRAVHIACGAALLNLRLAAVVAGRQPVVRLLPAMTQRLLLATVRLAGRCQAQPGEAELRAAIPQRRTNRFPFSARPVPPGILAELREAARLEGAVLHFPDHGEAHRLLQLAQDAERELLADPGYRAELARWAGGARDQEGIPEEALAPRDPAGTAPVRDFGPARRGPAQYAWFEERPQLAVLSTESSSRPGWLRAGQALQRVLLTATVRDIAASPLTAPLETPDAWLVRDPGSGFDYPQMILRFGYGLPGPHSPRRPVSEVLDTSG
ncbi:MAG TPA: nitroreductase family protein [Streptosporangiaceae bacterium]|nr:nitroreductase family protein [Streptosporangiaceae bacterium]